MNLVGESAEYNIVAKLVGIDEIGGVFKLHSPYALARPYCGLQNVARGLV